MSYNEDLLTHLLTYLILARIYMASTSQVSNASGRSACCVD